MAPTGSIVRLRFLRSGVDPLSPISHRRAAKRVRRFGPCFMSWREPRWRYSWW
jgi:hypothetical protein